MVPVGRYCLCGGTGELMGGWKPSGPQEERLLMRAVGPPSTSFPWRGVRQLLIFKPVFKVKEKSFPSSTMIAVGSGTLPLPTSVRTAGCQPSAGQQLYQLFQPRLQVCDKISIVLASCMVLWETITTASCLFQHSVRFEMPHFETWLTFKIPSNSKMSWFESLEKV